MFLRCEGSSSFGPCAKLPSDGSLILDEHIIHHRLRPIEFSPTPLKSSSESQYVSFQFCPCEAAYGAPYSIMSENTPNLTLYFLQGSRSIRIAWLLEELKLPYALKCWNREPSGLAPLEFKQLCGFTQGKAPVLLDGELVL